MGTDAVMTFPLSRLMSSATASYGVYAFADPRHLGRALTSKRGDQEAYDVLAQTYGARDLVVSAFGILGKSERTVATAMKARILLDISDGLLLSVKAEDEKTRTKVLAVTMGWATLNLLALTVDRARSHG